MITEQLNVDDAVSQDWRWWWLPPELNNAVGGNKDNYLGGPGAEIDFEKYADIIQTWHEDGLGACWKRHDARQWSAVMKSAFHQTTALMTPSIFPQTLNDAKMSIFDGTHRLIGCRDAGRETLVTSETSRYMAVSLSLKLSPGTDPEVMESYERVATDALGSAENELDWWREQELERATLALRNPVYIDNLERAINLFRIVFVEALSVSGDQLAQRKLELAIENWKPKRPASTNMAGGRTKGIRRIRDKFREMKNLLLIGRETAVVENRTKQTSLEQPFTLRSNSSTEMSDG